MKPWSAQYDPPVAGPLDIPAVTLDHFLTATADAHPQWVAMSFNDVDTSYRELEQKANRFARALLELGIHKGERVALLLPNSPVYPVAAFGAMKIGAVVVNIGVMTRGSDLGRILVHTGARVLVTLDLFLAGALGVLPQTPVEVLIWHSVAGLEQGADFSKLPQAPRAYGELLEKQPADGPPSSAVPTDVALLQLTGGTTRHPKAVALTHRNLVANVVQLDSCVRAPDVDNGAVMCLLPFFHIFGFEICLQLSVFKGYRMVLVARFDPTSLLPTLQLVDKYRPISFPAVPALWAALTKHAGEYESALRHIAVPSSGGAPLDPAVQRAFEQLTGRRIAVAYGLSEAPATHLTPLGKPLRPGSIGIPLPDTDARIVDVETGTQPLPANEVGELVVRGPQVMQAYWHADEAAESSMRLRDGWLYTGDLARMDEDGFFYVVDRKDDLIITSGFNVCPSDVEALLRQHPAVQDVAVVGIPDSVRGQSITAVVVLSEGHSVTNEDLLLHCREHLPAHQVPRAIERVAEIPKSPVGKPLRRVLRQQRAPK